MPVRGKKKEKLVIRRVSLATRKRQSQLSKERQGQDGKWESNKKKAGFKEAQRHSHNMNKLLMSVKERSATELVTTMKEAVRLTAALKASPNQAESALLKIIASLEKLQVTAKVLAKTLLPKVLLEACKHAPKAAAAASSLRLRWRQQFREEQAQRRDKASSPSVAVQNAKGDGHQMAASPRTGEAGSKNTGEEIGSDSDSYSDSGSEDSDDSGSDGEGEDGSEASESESAEEDAEMGEPEPEAADENELRAKRSKPSSPPPKLVVPPTSTPSPASPPVRTVATPQQKYPPKSTRQTMLTAFLKPGQQSTTKA